MGIVCHGVLQLLRGAQMLDRQALGVLQMRASYIKF